MIDQTTSRKNITLTINDTEVSVPDGTTIWDAAREMGIEIPALCHSPRLEPQGVCRMCVVDVGERVLAASCVRECAEGMTVQTHSEKVERQRKTLTELLLAEHPSPCEKEKTTADCELERLARDFELIADEKSTAKCEAKIDVSSPVIAVDHAACILCDRCVRACDDLQSNHVIGRTGKGHTAAIAFDLNDPMGQSTCVSCGECVSECPTGALINKTVTDPLQSRETLRNVDSVCPYCGVGCATTFHATDNKIVFADGRKSPSITGGYASKGVTVGITARIPNA